MNRGRRALWLVLAACTAVLDLWSKGLWRYPARPEDPPVLERVVIEGWLQIETTWNVGAIWSLPIAPTILLWATGLAVPLLAWWLFYPDRPSLRENLAKVLVLGGAIGNFYDRWADQAVRDWIDVELWGWDYPTFNVADIALVTGIVILLFSGVGKKEATA